MNRITHLFNIQYPIIQAGMIWCSGWELASAVSNAGGLGLIGSGSMYPDILREHIIKCKNATDKPFGVNLPLLYPQTDEHIQVILDEEVKIVFTSAGNPRKFTSQLKENGITVVHVVANVKFAKKCEEAGVDAIVAERAPELSVGVGNAIGVAWAPGAEIIARVIPDDRDLARCLVQ